jgi:hypothetical protein
MIASFSWETIDSAGFEVVWILLSIFWQATVLLGVTCYAVSRRRSGIACG